MDLNKLVKELSGKQRDQLLELLKTDQEKRQAKARKRQLAQQKKRGLIWVKPEYLLLLLCQSDGGNIVRRSRLYMAATHIGQQADKLNDDTKYTGPIIQFHIHNESIDNCVRRNYESFYNLNDEVVVVKENPQIKIPEKELNFIVPIINQFCKAHPR
jgi:hypothetical protein